MSYESAQAFRTSLEARLAAHARETGTSLDRLRRRVIFERTVARLEAFQPGRWVLKGGMALEVRLGNSARVTKDVDVGLRERVSSGHDLREDLIETLARDLDGDRFTIAVGAGKRLAEDGGGEPTWRFGLTAELAGRAFGSLKLDVSPRPHELASTERLAVPNSLHFAGFGPVESRSWTCTATRPRSFMRFRGISATVRTRACATWSTSCSLTATGCSNRRSLQARSRLCGRSGAEPACRAARESPHTFEAATARATALWASLFDGEGS